MSLLTFRIGSKTSLKFKRKMTYQQINVFNKNNKREISNVYIKILETELLMYYFASQMHKSLK